MFKISQTADEFGSVDRTAQYRYPAMTKTMIPKAVSKSVRSWLIDESVCLVSGLRWYVRTIDQSSY